MVKYFFSCYFLWKSFSRLYFHSFFVLFKVSISSIFFFFDSRMFTFAVLQPLGHSHPLTQRDCLFEVLKFGRVFLSPEFLNFGSTGLITFSANVSFALLQFTVSALPPSPPSGIKRDAVHGYWKSQRLVKRIFPGTHQ